MYRTLSHPNPIKDYKFIAIVITLCLLGGCATQADTHEADRAISEEAISQALRDSEARFAERADVENLRKAVLTLGRARDLNNRNFEVEWKFAKYSYFLGKTETDETKATE